MSLVTLVNLEFSSQITGNALPYQLASGRASCSSPGGKGSIFSTSLLWLVDAQPLAPQTGNPIEPPWQFDLQVPWLLVLRVLC